MRQLTIDKNLSEKSERELYLDAIRAISTMAVILLHISVKIFTLILKCQHGIFSI